MVLQPQQLFQEVLMIHSLEGLVFGLEGSDLLLSVGPITLRLSIPTSALGKIAPVGSVQKMFTSLVWKETGPQLYGFCQTQDLALFEKLIAINGVGPKLALSLLGHYEPSEMALHFQSGDIKALSRVPGIGNKTAERLIVELRDKAGKWHFTPSRQESLPHLEDALKALINLGYSQPQAQKMLEKASKETTATDLGSLISSALRLA